jgi:hypothetical protein
VPPGGADPRPDGFLSVAALLDGVGDQGGFLAAHDVSFLKFGAAHHARLRGDAWPGRKSGTFKGCVNREAARSCRKLATEASGLERHARAGSPRQKPCYDVLMRHYSKGSAERSLRRRRPERGIVTGHGRINQRLRSSMVNRLGSRYRSAASRSPTGR